MSAVIDVYFAVTLYTLVRTFHGKEALLFVDFILAFYSDKASFPEDWPVV